MCSYLSKILNEKQKFDQGMNKSLNIIKITKIKIRHVLNIHVSFMYQLNS